MVRGELDTFIGALRFFTRLPIPGPFGRSALSLGTAIAYFSAAGVVVGGLSALAYALALRVWPVTLAVAAAMGVGILVTGALHEDGWSDMVDGFGGGHSRERTLAIMRDSALGSFGAVSLVVVLLARYFALVEIAPRLVPAALIAAHAFSRACAAGIHGVLDYARAEGKAGAFNTRLTPFRWGVSCIPALVALAFLPVGRSMVGVVFSLLATFWLGRLFNRRIGGYTGDCLGATQQLAEVAFYAGVLCRPA